MKQIDFKIIKRQRRIIALSEKAKEYMKGKISSDLMDIKMNKLDLDGAYGDLKRDGFSAVDGNGKRLRTMWLFPTD